MIALLLLPLYILANYYVIRWLIRWLDAMCRGHLRTWGKVVIHIIIWTVSLALYVTALIPEGYIKRIFHLTGTYWYGIIIYIMMLFFVLDVPRIIIRRIKRVPRGEPLVRREVFIAIGAAFIVAIAAITLWGSINARIIRGTQYNLDIDKSANNLGSLNMVLVSDQHMGYSIGVNMMRDMVSLINSYNPDIVIIAGDIFDNNYDALAHPDELIDIYNQIESKYGVYAVYGNHDVAEPIVGGFSFPSDEGRTADTRMDDFLKKAHIVNLRDEYVLIDDAFYIYGRPDYQKLGRGITTRNTPEEVTANLDLDKPILVIDHQPRELDELAKAGVDIDMSGHTHDGQFFPLNMTSKLTWPNSRGVLEVGDMYSIVTSGVGFYGPSIRVGTKAEVVDIKVNFKK